MKYNIDMILFPALEKIHPSTFYIILHEVAWGSSCISLQGQQLVYLKHLTPTPQSICI